MIKKFLDLVNANKQRAEDRRRERNKNFVIGGIILAIVLATKDKGKRNH